MPQTLNLNNFSDANIVETSELNADAVVGALSLTLKGTQGFLAADYLLIGQRGSETAELRIAGTPNADLITLPITVATKFAHNRFDQITKLFGNKQRIYRAANVNGSIPAAASFALVDTIDIDIDQMSTRWTDATGDENYWYKRTYYNSTSLGETPIGEAVAYRGSQYPAYATIEEIRDKAGLSGNRWITDEKIDEKRRAAQAIIDARLTGLYTVPFTVPVNPLIKEITQLLAAGYLLTQEATSASARAQGQALIDQATNDKGTGLLDRIDTKELKLTGMTGSPETVTDAGGFNAWPNGTTAEAEPEVGGGARMFRVSDRY